MSLSPLTPEDPKSASIRRACFDWLANAKLRYGDVLSRDLLAAGLELDGQIVRMIGPQGIFKPSQISYYPLSITTTTKGPYEDAFAPDSDLLLYRYRGDDPGFHENVRLRHAMRDKIPLVYFHSTVPGRYLVEFPVFVVRDDPGRLTFSVAADDRLVLTAQHPPDDVDEPIRRRYVTRQTRQRIHQSAFRDRVLAAYQQQCTICRLKHSNMLDAAHITPDAEEAGEPVVSNGLSLCKLHHAAYDRSLFGISPDYRVQVRRDILLESDGPMLKHGLQEIHRSQIKLPRQKANQPDKDRLDQRFQLFLAAKA